MLPKYDTIIPKWNRNVNYTVITADEKIVYSDSEKNSDADSAD